MQEMLQHIRDFAFCAAFSWRNIHFACNCSQTDLGRQYVLGSEFHQERRAGCADISSD